LTNAQAQQESLALVERSGVLMLTTLDANGFPETRAMLALEHEGLETFWFSTNTSSHKVTQIRNSPKACVYLFDPDGFHGLSLVGRVEVLQDATAKERFWREGFERYYPQGVTDPDYTVLRFRAERGEYYHGLSVVTFTF